jgi:hypothetical protein
MRKHLGASTSMIVQTAALIAKQAEYGKRGQALLSQSTAQGHRASKNVIYHSLSKAKNLQYKGEQDELFGSIARYL